MKDGAIDGSPPTPSTELQAWLDKRDMHWRLKEAIHAEGGSIMLKSTTTDPTTLDEPLRSEALEYLRCIGQWHD